LGEGQLVRLRIKLALAGKEIPLNYKHYVQSLVYSMMGMSDKFTQLHDVGNIIENRKYKLFVISDILGHFKINNETKSMAFLNNGYFELASIDEDILIEVTNYLNLNRVIHIGKVLVEHNGYDVLSPRLEVKDVVEFESISPVTIYQTEENRTIYLEPESHEFIESIKQNIINKYLLVYERYPVEFEIKIIQTKRKRLVHFKHSFFVTYDITIGVTNATHELIDLLLCTGIGSKNSMGFGMLKRL